MSIVLVGGGVRSGKSRYALERARVLSAGQGFAFIATAQALDEEMAERIARHRRERDESIETYEEPIALAERLGALGAGVVLVDCLTLWLSNLLLAHSSDADIEAAVEDLLGVTRARQGPTLLVTNEVGLGVVPPSALGRRFRDHSGTLHQRLAAHADEVVFAVMGLPLQLKPGPVRAV